MMQWTIQDLVKGGRDFASGGEYGRGGGMGVGGYLWEGGGVCEGVSRVPKWKENNNQIMPRCLLKHSKILIL